jgi:hypothetical protein
MKASNGAIRSLIIQNHLIPADLPLRYQSDAPSSSACPCCMGCLDADYIAKLADQIYALAKGHDQINLTINTPDVFDALRIAVRTVITRVAEKTFPFPTFSELLMRILSSVLKSRHELLCVDEVDAKLKVKVKQRF